MLSKTDLPFPPIELMRSVGPTDRAAFDNPTGQNVLAPYGDFNYEAFLDFGCGCGRLARQIMQQLDQPKTYVGVDLNLPAIEWCQRNLYPHNPQFLFSHLNVRNPQFNPTATETTARLPADDGRFTLAIAHSVFTHIIEDHCEHYLRECARTLATGGDFVSTWFTFDKAAYPMMQTFQNALYIHPGDPTNAVIYDQRFLLDLFARCDLGITKIIAPEARGFHYVIVAKKGASQVSAFPADTAPIGVHRPPVSTERDATT